MVILQYRQGWKEYTSKRAGCCGIKIRAAEYNGKKGFRGNDMKSGAQTALDFMLRAVFGMIAVQLINPLLAEQGVEAFVGMNPLSFVTTGILGIPGVVLLYGIQIYL